MIWLLCFSLRLDRFILGFAGDMNIDIIKFSKEEVVSYMTTLMSYGYLPYITIPSRITHLSMTCIDHIFIELFRRRKILNISSSPFCCEISNNLPWFVSIIINKICWAGERPFTKIIWRQKLNCICSENGVRKVGRYLLWWWWLL